jgi:hypothetical protein
MGTWLFRRFSGSASALASWQPTHQTAVRALRRTLKAHEKKGHSIDPSKITGELEHRYSVCNGPELIAVYWLSASDVLQFRVPDPQTRPTASAPRLAGSHKPH